MDRRADYTQRQRRAFATALQGARGDVSTRELADQLGYRSPGTISHWEKGESPPEPPVVFALEDRLGLTPGTLSQHLGFLPVAADAAPCTVETALVSDLHLTEDRREILRNIYRDFVSTRPRRG